MDLPVCEPSKAMAFEPFFRIAMQISVPLFAYVSATSGALIVQRKLRGEGNVTLWQFVKHFIIPSVVPFLLFVFATIGWVGSFCLEKDQGLGLTLFMLFIRSMSTPAAVAVLLVLSPLSLLLPSRFLQTFVSPELIREWIRSLVGSNDPPPPPPAAPSPP